MGKLTRSEIQALAKKIIAETAGGIRYAPLVEKIHSENPETPPPNIHNALFRLQDRFPNEISKPSRGLYRSNAEDATIPVSTPVDEAVEISTGPSESDFYDSFADYLKSEVEELNHVEALGGAGLKRKWGTPDIIGVYKPRAKDPIKFDLEIISGEVKTDPKASIVAFGQAISYRLFSHKTYIAMPKTIALDDLGRLESLCMLFGVGLVLFDVNKEIPNYNIRVRAQRFAPDMFYLNEMANRIREFEDNELFERLFG